VFHQLGGQISFPEGRRVTRAVKAAFKATAAPRLPNLWGKFHIQFSNCCGVKVRLARIDHEELLA
jgi:hypothetical protein